MRMNGKTYKLIAKAQAVGDGLGSFRYRNLYEPETPEKSAFLERVSIPLTGYIDAEKSRYLDKEPTIKKHSVDGTGLYSDGIHLTGYELYRLAT